MKGFHGYADMVALGKPSVVAQQIAAILKRTTIVQRDLDYTFYPHFHPYVGRLVDELVERSVKGLQASDTATPVWQESLLTTQKYAPTSMVKTPYPVKDLDFSISGGYSVYNWELFYHVPLTIAIHLSRAGRFAEAQRWFHYVFDPTDDGPGETPQRFWKVKPFQTAEVTLIEEVLVNLSTGADPKLREETIASIGAWKDAPFRPHVVARYRQSAYMIKAVTSYLDNLIAWGDSLFREDSGESLNEATQLYVLAAGILGPRPQEIPRKGWQRPQTYSKLRSDLDAMSNAMRAVEADIPFDLNPHPPGPSDNAQLATLRSIGSALYFCIPRNDMLLGYWDTVADRLFKLRNSLNLQGVFRQLPLFEPPIDPGMLARAAAAGLNVSAILGGLNQPLPLVRFATLVSKASEICQEVKTLGGLLLSAIEKEDAEELAALRAKHERIVLGLADVVRYQTWQEAIKAREGVEQSLANAASRYVFYERQLARSASDINIPEMSTLEHEGFETGKFKSAEPQVDPRQLSIDIAQSLEDSQGKIMSSFEAQELKKLAEAHDSHGTASTYEKIGGAMALIPSFTAKFQPFGAGGSIGFGGSNLAAHFSLIASFHKSDADDANYEASKAAKIAAMARRELDWQYHSNVAAGEMNQAYKQLRAAQIREAITQREWANHQKQMEHAEAIEKFLTDERAGKTSRKSLYTWLRRETRGLYGQVFDVAHDIARKAERALQHELGDPNRTFLGYTYQAGSQGLLAGEKLWLDIKRMELAYQELNRREYELTKHVSLLQTDPRALVQLRATGKCTITLPEELFDLDCPGHYFRRLKAVALSVPCVVGPYASVNATLTLTRSSVRISPSLGDNGYARDGDDTTRFSDHYGGVQSVVTSTGHNDSGMFEVNLRDERYLPFEGSGAVSEWRLELPAELP
ncbi:MAG TPA: insecticidal toxin protein, partial [Micromonosporaceae bacterium]|nr:insecticidal toxin protein [Micromonosporaceae bacterium]